MNDQEILDRAERAARSVVGPTDAYDALLCRRDRQRRNQRITAGLVGIAVFVAAIWFVRDVASLNRSEKSVVPAESGSTGPAETGPTVAFPDGWDGHGIPPEGTPLSTPAEGRPILVQDAEYEEFLGERTECVSQRGCRERRAWYNTHLVVYSDGRVLWWHDLRGACDESGCPGGGDYVLERRLTSQGIDLITSGVDLTYIVPTLVRGNPVESDLPDSAWAGVTARPYAPPRYAVCFEPNDATRPNAFQALDPAIDLVPASARALLDGSNHDSVHPGCLVLSTEDARAFYGIMSDAGFDPAADHGDVTPGSAVGAWLLRGAENIYGEQVGIYLHPLWPDGEWHHLESG